MVCRSDLVRILGRLGGYSASRWLCRDTPRVLMYHRFSDDAAPGFVSRETFRRQLAYLKEHGLVTITLGEAALAISRAKPIPKNVVILTVDDGYEDFYRIAYPILKEQGVSATFFVTTGFVNRDLWLWTDQVAWLLQDPFSVKERGEVSGFAIEPGVYDKSRRSALGRGLLSHFLSIPDSRKREAILELSNLIGRPLPAESPSEFSAVTWPQLLEMQENGIEIGGHTVTHPSLGQVDYAQAEKEILGCMAALTENLGERPRTFCYPNGMPSDFQSFLPGLIAKAGFKGACVAFPDSMGPRNLFAIRRHSSGENWFQFEKAISGMEYLGHRLRGTVRLVG